MKSVNTANTTGISATINEAGQLVITMPLMATPTLTKNEKNYTVAQTGTWPQNWVTVDVNGTSVGLTVCALVKNPEHPDNKPAPVVVAPPVPKFFTKPAAVAKPGGNGNGLGKRAMPAIG